MDETKYAKAFELIMNAGNAKSLALMAVESACLLYTSDAADE